MKRLQLATLFLCCAIAQGMAQTDYVSDDAGSSTGGIWTEISAAKILPYDLTLDLEAGFRTNEWFDEASRYNLGVGLNWKPAKHWKFGVGYTFIMKHYPLETAYKNGTDYEWKYRASDAEENTDFTEFMGAPTYTDDAGTAYTYKGYNAELKDYTRITESYWRPKHRLSFDAAYTYKFWKTLRVTLRERYQLTFVPSKTVNRTRTGTKTTTKYRDPSYDADGNLVDGELGDSYDEVETVTEDAGTELIKEKDRKTLNILRSRLTFEIDKKDWRWNPYVYVESFNNMGDQWHLDKIRGSIGVDYSLIGGHKIGLGYVFNREKDEEGDQTIHAISIGYRYKF